MQFNKKNIIRGTMFIIFSLFFLYLPQVNALDVPLPLDIHMTIDTVEIDINDIPENRIVPVDVYLENSPEFTGVWLFFEKDARLSIAPVISFVVAEGVENAGTINTVTNVNLEPNKIGCGVPSEYPNTINHSGAFVRINAVIPEDAQIGDFYSISFSRYFADNSMSIDFGLESDDRYFEESFTKLNNGGILITGDTTTESVPPKEPDVDYNDDENNNILEDDYLGDTDESDESDKTNKEEEKVPETKPEEPKKEETSIDESKEEIKKPVVKPIESKPEKDNIKNPNTGVFGVCGISIIAIIAIILLIVLRKKTFISKI